MAGTRTTPYIGLSAEEGAGTLVMTNPSMQILPERPDSALFPLGADWRDVPDRRTTNFSDDASEWRTALSAAFCFPLSVSSTTSGPFGAITSVQRGSVRMHRLTMKPQIISSNLDTLEASSLVVLILVRGTATYANYHNRQSVGPGDILPIRFWDEFFLEANEELEAVALDVPLWWIIHKSSDLGMLRWGGSECLTILSDFFLNPVLLSSVNSLLFSTSLDEKTSMSEELFGCVLIHLMNSAASLKTLITYDRGRFSRIYDYMTRNIMKEGLSPRDAAEDLKFSVRTLHQTCSEKGTTFNSMLADMRLGYAAYLLRNGDARISEIAFTVGYGSLPHFCRQFKEKYGISARNYRNAQVG